MHNIKVHKIDPKEEEIQKGGIAQYNPLLDGTPEKCGDIISSILVSMDNDDGNNKGNSYFVNAGVRAIRNIVILLKVMYPKVYNTNPTLDDVLALLNDFDKVVPLVEEMKKDPYLNKRWRTIIVYFETRFYPVPTDDKGKPIFGARLGSKRAKTEKSIEGIVNQLDNFLGREEIRYILCDRENSISLEEVLENGDCLAIASRQAELGDKLGKAFALFFILSIQNAVLSRYSEDENPTIPHFILIDEFPFYLNDSTKTFFSFSRKYNCSINVVIQNMAQLREVSDEFRQIIFTNTGTKILLGGINAEDQKYWSDLFGTEEKLELQTGFSQNPLLSENGKMTESIRGSIKESAKVTTQELNELEFKNVYCMYKNNKGERVVAKGYTDFLNISDKKEDKEYFNFEKFNKNSFKPITNVEEPKKETFENIE
ncbi:MAG: TraM recognition domain-containing protein [Inconstantimicrobium porci]|uniref:type IV secretory system conjugative DNA transfer family protein n=1 Tax=Inconstantimicrobium porci TaxID=2652291 RepID=UPI002A917C11|nr:TraM recognition domain-containing protein [Inconstantimicrobium porci]MDY5911077.1 TraM recognition domain-containing protein [Inconstantimicrobium porci]